MDKTIEEKLEIAINALEAIVKRDIDWNSSKPLTDRQKCAENALKMIK